ncbi:coenzyme PQQ precursor peptide PqqA [Pseudomonas sp. S3E17]|nr:coenzyme PQQ precursor peptide PqqA [Pseudomonas sp. S3E17]
MLPIAVGQSTVMWLIHRHREQAPSHILLPVHSRLMQCGIYFESSIRTPIPPCINAFTGIFRHNKRTLPMWTKPAFTDLRIGFEVTMYFASR